MENVKKNITYFELIKLIDEIFPSKKVLDYTKVKVEELVSRFNNIISKSGFSFDPQKLQIVREMIRENQKYLFGRKSNLTSEDSRGFDQENYQIQYIISIMKNETLWNLYNARIHLVKQGEDYDTGYFGSLDLIKSTVTEENIMKYIEEVLSVTRPSFVRISNSQFNPSTIATDILSHFGLDCDRYFGSRNREIYSEIEQIISDLSRRSLLGIRKTDNDYIYGQRALNDYETGINRIKELICMVALPAVEKTEEKINEANKSKKTTPLVPKPRKSVETPKKKNVAPRPKKTPEKSKTPITKSKKSTPTPENGVSEEELSTDLLASLQAKLDELMKLLAKNRRVLERVEKTRDAMMKENDVIQKQIAEVTDEMQNALNGNSKKRP